MSPTEKQTSNQTELSRAQPWRPDARSVGLLSEYDSARWVFDYRTVGQDRKQAEIKWDMRLPDGSTLLDDRWTHLREQAKCFVWTLFFARVEGTPLSFGSAGKTGAALKDLLSWMAQRGLSSFGEIDSKHSWDYVRWVWEERKEWGERKRARPTWAVAHSALHVLSLLFQQRTELSTRGYDPMPDEPFDGRSPLDIVHRELRLKRGGRLAPLSDDIAIPTLVAAVKWVVERSDDVLRLHEEHVAILRTSNSVFERQQRARELNESFQFSTDPATGKPWASLNEVYHRKDSDGNVRVIISGIAPRRLVTDLLAAALIVLQGMAGVRASDIASLRAGYDDERGLPTCIKIAPSLDGMLDVFLLEGVEQKRSHAPHEWSLGVRISGSREVPFAVQAVIVMERLLRPYRDVATSDRLVVSLANGRGFSLLPDSVGNATASWMTNIQREFMTNRVGLDLTKHKVNSKSLSAFRAQQWRSTFAHFAITANKRSLGPLARHFHHASVQMTELGYIGNDPELRKMMNDSMATVAANLFYEVITNPASVSGRFASHLRKTASNFSAEIRDLDREEAVNRLRALVVQHDLRLHFTDYGSCAVAVRPLVALCHEAGGTASDGNVRPNFSHRHPGLCAGCQNFLVTRDHLPYWEERESSLRKCMGDHGTESSWVLRRELAQARQIVKALRASAGGTP